MEKRYNKKFKDVDHAINYLMNKETARPIGFRIKGE
jgi:hypothetical protein